MRSVLLRGDVSGRVSAICTIGSPRILHFAPITLLMNPLHRYVRDSYFGSSNDIAQAGSANGGWHDICSFSEGGLAGVSLDAKRGRRHAENDIHTRARRILSKLQIPRNECDRYERDWARAVMDRNDCAALREWHDHCRYIYRCRIGE